MHVSPSNCPSNTSKTLSHSPIHQSVSCAVHLREDAFSDAMTVRTRNFDSQFLRWAFFSIVNFVQSGRAPSFRRCFALVSSSSSSLSTSSPAIAMSSSSSHLKGKLRDIWESYEDYRDNYSLRRWCLMAILIVALTLNALATLPVVLEDMFGSNDESAAVYAVASRSRSSQQDWDWDTWDWESDKYSTSAQFIHLTVWRNILHPAYTDNDYPELLPLPSPLAQTTLTVEKSMHYQMNGSQAEAEWSTALPNGGGVFWLPVTAESVDDKRPFTVTMFHQIKCLDIVRRAILQRAQQVNLQVTTPADQDSELAQDATECIAYLRQMTLCASDTTIEPQSVRAWEEDGITAVDGYDVMHVCRDWSVVWDAAEATRNSARR